MDTEPLSPESQPTVRSTPVIWWQNLSQRRKIVIGLASMATVGVGSLLAYAGYSYHKQTSQPVTTTAPFASPSLASNPTPTPTPALQPALLNGIMVPAGIDNIHPLAVIIENHPDARPQAGLGQADLVYEATVEGGITRFMAVFGNPNQPIKVGPIRSARPYYVDFATEINAFYAHIGGSIDALFQIQNTHSLDINGLTLGEPLFKRDFSRNVALEHTEYSSTDRLWNYATMTQKWSQTANYSPWLFQDDAATAARPASEKISISVSEPLYDVVWNYDSASNSYLRTMAGTTHIDANTGKQISVKTIITQTVTRSLYTESYGVIDKGVYKFNLTGSGSAVVFENGIATQATWKKDGTSRTRYYNSTTGKEIALVRGEIWINIVHPDSTITY